MKKLLIIIYTLYLSFFNTSCANKNSNEAPLIQSEQIENNVLKINETETDSKIEIEWNWINLKVERFRNGDYIPHAESNEEWRLAGENQQPAWCYYDNDTLNGKIYGKLYNWYAVNDPRGLAPKGWHIPSNEEWDKYIEQIGNEYNKDLNQTKNVAGRKMKANEIWQVDCVGTNETGFTGLPGGMRGRKGGFDYFGHNGFWWSSTEHNDLKAYIYSLYEHEDIVVKFDDLKAYGFSVRCIRD